MSNFTFFYSVVLGALLASLSIEYFGLWTLPVSFIVGFAIGLLAGRVPDQALGLKDSTLLYSLVAAGFVAVVGQSYGVSGIFVGAAIGLIGGLSIGYFVK